EDEIRARSTGAPDAWIRELVERGRILPARVAGQGRFIAAEDASRYRDALGAALPVGIPAAFLEPVADPLSDLVARFARTHGPFTEDDVAARFGLGRAVARRALEALEAEGRVVEGEFRPGGSGREWIEVEVLRLLRRRSLAAFRKEIEPVAPEILARFTVAWHGIGSYGPRAATPDALVAVVEQLQGAPLPASALETRILPSRLPGYSPALLDQLGASGEIVWCGAGPLGSADGWVALALADRADLLLPEQVEVDLSPPAAAALDALTAGGALFFRQIADASGSTDDAELLLALWELVWAGRITNDTLAPLRALLRGGIRTSRPSRSRRGPSLPSRTGPPAAAGRWSLVPERRGDPTRRLHATAEQLLVRHGIVTRGAAMSERVTGGFAGVYGVLKAFEESGRCRRGYFVEGLGGAQFAMPGAVDRLRSLEDSVEAAARTQVLAAVDPANPYGAALEWPEREGTHRPGRKAGALVVLVDGRLAIYVEKGGRSLLSYSDDPQVIRPAVDALALAAQDGALGRLTVERADGEAVEDTPFAEALIDAGFRPTSRGLRLRA
ncbi:MAG: winged helix DNA-binding domain-containing protein, partial [Actinomycetota bacterium]|nr:winged helix DNA-binding domain-containing protein [Actinomycetota bacterium]